MQVSGDQLKFSVRLDNWPWSSSCNEANQQAVDIDVILKLPPGRMAKEDGQRPSPGRPKRPKRFDLGYNATITFPREVRYSDKLTTPSGVKLYS